MLILPIDQFAVCGCLLFLSRPVFFLVSFWLLYDFAVFVQVMIQHRPDEARQLLSQNVPLAHALLQIQLMLGMMAQQGVHYLFLRFYFSLSPKHTYRRCGLLTFIHCAYR